MDLACQLLVPSQARFHGLGMSASCSKPAASAASAGARLGSAWHVQAEDAPWHSPKALLTAAARLLRSLLLRQPQLDVQQVGGHAAEVAPLGPCAAAALRAMAAAARLPRCTGAGAAVAGVGVLLRVSGTGAAGPPTTKPAASVRHWVKHGAVAPSTAGRRARKGGIGQLAVLSRHSLRVPRLSSLNSRAASGCGRGRHSCCCACRAARLPRQTW